ncbi:sulfotransferase family 2 domain-containing protein [Roseobacter sp. EG26]|uniref:sulfotransferase family 2 domain-containing protein n=1 Tax=Roseobacter sp. EG26 TaxID=3412477 RepID=UPI003CE5077E
MAAPFASFVIFAEMRTGSNLLEANLNAVEGIACHGEAFNPHFIGYPNREELLGITMDEREGNPTKLLNKINTSSAGLSGFRYFHDHDPRVLDLILENRECAKIILTRNPVDSYVSWKIAQATGQWKLTDVKRRKDAKAKFDADEFEIYRNDLQRFQNMLQSRLQTSGQSAFFLTYEDLQSIDVVNGLIKFLGASGHLEKLDTSLKVQNPAPVSCKVSNFVEMEAALAKLDCFDLAHAPNFEPRRLAAVPTYVACAETALLYLPIKGGPRADVTNWMANLDNVRPEDLITGMSQKELRQWKRRHQGHRSFSVLRHPVARAHGVFCDHILGYGAPVFDAVRRTLIKRYGLDIPATPDEGGYDLERHKAAFLGFVEFLRKNLAGQTAIRVDAAWCSQSEVVQGFAQFALPDVLIREDGAMEDDLDAIAMRAGHTNAPRFERRQHEAPFRLADVYDEEVERAVSQAYQRDYMMFGFERWA